MPSTSICRFIAGFALVLVLPPAHAALGGTTTFAGAEVLCSLRGYGDDGAPLKRASGVLIAPDTVATARHVMSPGTTRLNLRCGLNELNLDVRGLLDHRRGGPDLVLITLPAALAVQTRVRVPRSEPEWTEARARAVEIYAAGYGGQYDLDADKIEAILRAHAPERIDPRMVSRDAARIARLMTQDAPRVRDPYLGSLITPDVAAALRSGLQDVRPTALPVRVRDLPRRRPVFGYLTDPGGSVYVGDSGGAIFGRDGAGEVYVLGIISRGGLRLAALPPHLRRVRHAWARVMSFRRRGLRGMDPATPAVFATRLTRADRTLVIAPRYCQDSLTRD